MAIPRAKKKKLKLSPELMTQFKKFVKEEVHKSVKMANYLNIGIMAMNMHVLHGWGYKRIGDFLEAHLALLAEVADGRITIWKLLQQVENETGYDIKKMVDEAYKK